jgi:LmbE family N-acetylglucosaminyl deacetylase
MLSQAGALDVRSVVLSGIDERRSEAELAAELFVPGARVSVLGLTDGRLPAVWNEVKAALEGLSDEAPPPDLVLCPRPDDAHQDHRLVGELVTTVWRDSLILHYEIPKWDGDLGRVTHYVPVTPELATRKVELLFKAYPSQHGRDWWDEETFLALMRLRGMECRNRYAEGFVVSKAVLAASPSG